jgi:hypothetical protein
MCLADRPVKESVVPSHLASPERASATVETALAAVLFFMLVVGILDVGRMHFYRSNLQHAVSNSARFATLGSTLDDPAKSGTKLSREESIVQMIRTLSGIPTLDNDDVKIAAVTPDGRTVAGAGGPGDVITITASHDVSLVAPYLHLMFPGGRYHFQCTASFRSEEYNGL